ncbi:MULTISPECIES: serine hydrolase domain-containing protein [unclassified Ligilactobacillus]|uniref:serine hydrolase domain-containing protein n=1 Tax=unclassified Ligilactobacillus TaxID=2767920 RepID=UPI003854E3D5
MFAQTTALLNQMITTGVVPGMAWALIHGDTVIKRVEGKAAVIPQAEPLRPGMLYDVASLTKVVGTTTVLLHLMEAGQLDVDCPVVTYLPEFFDSRVTIRHLLTHTAAISGYIPHRDQLTGSQLINALMGLHIGSRLGRQVRYTDLGLIFAGLVVEAVTGMPVQEAIRRIVLRPLGMRHSTFTPRDPAKCVPTTVTPGGNVLRGVVHDPKARQLQRRCGSAGLFTTLDDLITFCQWMMTDEFQHPIISSALINRLFADWTPTGTLGRSLGWDLRYTSSGQVCLHHTGYTGPMLLIDKQAHDALILLTNRVHPQQDNHTFIDRRAEVVQVYLAEKESVS